MKAWSKKFREHSMEATKTQIPWFLPASSCSCLVPDTSVVIRPVRKRWLAVGEKAGWVADTVAVEAR